MLTIKTLQCAPIVAAAEAAVFQLKREQAKYRKTNEQCAYWHHSLRFCVKHSDPKICNQKSLSFKHFWLMKRADRDIIDSVTVKIKCKMKY